MIAEAELPDEAWLTALLSLEGMGPARLTQLLEHGDARGVWGRIRQGEPIRLERVPANVIDGWRDQARAYDAVGRWQAAQALGIDALELGSVDYPQRLMDDPEPPLMLYRRGRLLGDGPTVAIVGTRRCTSYGRRMAFELGAALADAGVSVISGLALGIDAAAHEGVLSRAGAPPVAVTGSGLDVVYPKRNARLWEQVAGKGTLLSEAPPGAIPARWRFPARNRIIAGLADAVVVIESHRLGGSLLTVDEAQLRDVPVGVVPGPVVSPSSEGSNLLLVDGATPVLAVEDVLAMIGHAPTVPRLAGRSAAAEPSVTEGDAALLEAMEWGPVLVDHLCARLALGPIEITLGIERLVAAGLCQWTGPWVERVR